MPADNDVPGLLLSLRDLAGRCRPAAMLYLTEDDSNMLNEAADALDRAQRERDEAVNAYEKTMIQRDMARNELAGERRSHETLASQIDAARNQEEGNG